MNILAKRIGELVKEEYSRASILYNLGIPFYQHSESTLAEVCQVKKLDRRLVLKSLRSTNANADLSLRDYPVDLIIQYLRHSHFVFINKKLPFMARMIEDLDAEQLGNPQLIEDLQLLFPLFVDDFIHHIHEEEDRVFHYIKALHCASLNESNWTELYYLMEKYSVSAFMLDHHSHDDEMRGIRDLTNNYSLPPRANLHVQVLFSELLSLEKELLEHASIEDNILLVKALKLESMVKEMIKLRATSN